MFAPKFPATFLGKHEAHWFATFEAQRWRCVFGHKESPVGMMDYFKSISAMSNDSVFATKPKSAVTFYVNSVAGFTFSRCEDRFDCSNKLLTR